MLLLSTNLALKPLTKTLNALDISIATRIAYKG
jgi:hypothetical protein